MMLVVPLVLAVSAAAGAEAQIEAALAHFRDRRFNEARQYLDRALALAPGSAAAWKLLGMTYSAEENYSAAEEPFQKACRMAPALEDVCYYLGRDQYMLNKFEAAEGAFAKALRAGGKPWRAHNGMALTLEALGRSDAAEDQFRKAVELSSGAQPRPSESPRIDYGAFLYKQGRLDEAIRELSLAPPCFRSYFELGKALFMKERFEQAARELEKALAFPGGDASALLLLAKVYFRLGRSAEAERLLSPYR
ncbi:MAG: tetratricopeptide repeat protein [Bryobacterales bacterium]|nr:tetratricopeptide repeat protein [Bryobacterales bacterium]